MSRIPCFVLGAWLAFGTPIGATESPAAAAPGMVPANSLTEQREKGRAFLEKLDAEEGVAKKPSGLRIRIERPGEGWSPSATDRVKVHYRGTLVDGTEFDSSYRRDAPATFGLQSVIACWTEGLQLLRPGGKARLVCPSEIAYGDPGRPPVIPPGATLVFDVELLGIEPRKQQPAR